ncbi:hypothetical protein BDR22DRAFT_596102 [Usnea florida]
MASPLAPAKTQSSPPPIQKLEIPPCHLFLITDKFQKQSANPIDPQYKFVLSRSAFSLTVVMDHHYSRQSPYQPSAGQVYLDYLHLNGQDSSVDERVRAHELSVRPLSLYELEEHHKRHASLQRYANDHLKLVRATENGPITALRQHKILPAKTNNGKNCTQPERSSGVPNATARPRSRPLHIPSQNYREQQILDTTREHRGHTEFEISDQERRVARMGLGTQKCYGKGAKPHTTPALPEPVPTSHRCLQVRVPERKPIQQIQEQPKAQVQYSKSPGCCSLVQERTNDTLLKSQAREEAGRQQSSRECEQEMVQKVQLPAAKPGSLYPGPSRISDTLHPLHAKMEQAILSEIGNSAYQKSKRASREAYFQYKEEERELEEKRKGALSAPGSVSVATRTESVKRLLANVNKPLEQEVGAVGVEVADTRGVQNEAFQVQSQEPHKRPVDAFEAADSHGDRIWYNYNSGTPRSRNLGFASEQQLKASPDHPTAATVADRSAPQTRTIQREASTSSELSGVGATVDAINKTDGDLLGSHKTAPGPSKPPEASLKPLSIKRYGNRVVVHLARVSLGTLGKRSLDVSRQDVSPLPVPQQRDMSSEVRMAPEAIDALKLVLVVDSTESRGATENMEDTVEDAIESGWERIDGCLGDDEWSVVEQDSVIEVSNESPSSSDMEWAFDVDSEGWSHS